MEKQNEQTLNTHGNKWTITSDALSFTSHSWVKKWNSVIIPSGFIMMTYSKNYPVFSFGSSLLSFLFFAFKPQKTHWELIIQNVHTKSKIPLIMWIISYYGDLCQNHICYVGTCIRYPKLIEAGFFLTIDFVGERFCVFGQYRMYNWWIISPAFQLCASLLWPLRCILSTLYILTAQIGFVRPSDTRVY